MPRAQKRPGSRLCARGYQRLLLFLTGAPRNVNTTSLDRLPPPHPERARGGFSKSFQFRGCREHLLPRGRGAGAAEGENSVLVIRCLWLGRRGTEVGVQLSRASHAHPGEARTASRGCRRRLAAPGGAVFRDQKETPAAGRREVDIWCRCGRSADGTDGPSEKPSLPSLICP